MSLFGRIGQAGRILVGRADYSDYGAQLTDLGWFGSGGLFEGSGRNTKAWLETLLTHPRLAAVVDRISTDVGKTRWLLLENDPKTGKPREAPKDHPFRLFMANPWKTSTGGSWSTLIALAAVYILIDGNAFLRLRMNDAGTPEEAWPLAPHLVSSVPCSKKSYYLLAAETEEACDRLKPGEVLWMRRPNPLNPYGRGWGQARALDDEVSQDTWAAKYNNAWFKNGARPDLLISMNEVNATELKRIEETWKSKYTGISNAFKTFFLSTEAKVHNMATSHKDMEWAEGRKLLRDIIFQRFGVPPEILGVVENSNRATAEAALYIYSLQCILPMVSAICDDLNRLLVPLFNPEGRQPVYLGFESPVRETEEFKLDRAERLFKAGLLTRDETRDITGFDPCSDSARGEEYLVPANMVAIGPGDPRPRPEKKPTDTEQPKKSARRGLVTIYAPRDGAITEMELERAA